MEITVKFDIERLSGTIGVDPHQVAEALLDELHSNYDNFQLKVKRTIVKISDVEIGDVKF